MSTAPSATDQYGRAIGTRRAVLALVVATFILGAAIGTERWTIVLALVGLTGLAVVWVMPSWVPLALAVILFRWAPQPLVGVLTASDVLILMWLYQQVLAVRLPSLDRADRWLLGFLAVGFTSTVVHGLELGPMLRIAIYALVFLMASGGFAAADRIAAVVRHYAIAVVVVSSFQLPGRMSGVTIGDPQQLGVLLLAAISLAPSHAPRWQRVVLWCGVAATLTRGVWLAAIVYLVVRHRPRRGHYVATALGVGLLGAVLYGPATAALGLNPDSAELRGETITRGIDAGLRSPLLGQGWSATLETVRDETGRVIETLPPYNVLVAVFAYVGICGVVAYSVFLWHTLGDLQRRDRQAFAFAATFITLSMFEPLLYAGSLATFLFFLLTALGRSRPPTLHGEGTTDLERVNL